MTMSLRMKFHHSPRSVPALPTPGCGAIARCMSTVRAVCSAGCLCVLLVASLPAAEALRPVDLVGQDAAVVGELHRPKAAWDEFQRGELFRRFQASELSKAFLQSDGVRKWGELERKVSEATGAPLSEQLLELCSQELLLAVYFSPANRPEGVLLTRADDGATVQRVLGSWQRLEPDAKAQMLKHHGQAYFRRAQVGPRKASLYYVTFGDVFALSDQETRIQQVIDLQQSGPARPANPANRPKRFKDEPVYKQTTPVAESPAAVARLLLPAGAWERLLHDAPATDPGAALLRRIWPALAALTLELRSDQGLQLEARLHLHAEQTDDRWKAWCAPTPRPEEFLATVPPEAVAVAAGGIHFHFLWKFLEEIVPPHEQAGWQKPRRVIQGFLGGRDLPEQVLPALTHQVGAYLLFSPRNDDVPFEGVLACRFPEDERAAGMHLALDQAFAAGLALLSIQVNDKLPDNEPATVRSEVADNKILRWLQTPLPMRLAYQLTSEGLTASRSIETLRAHLSAAAAEPSKSIFAAHRNRWFADAGQFVCVDVRRLREQLELISPPNLSSKPDTPDGNTAHVDLPRELIRFCDTAFLSTRFEAGLVTLRLGVIAEPRR